MIKVTSNSNSSLWFSKWARLPQKYNLLTKRRSILNKDALLSKTRRRIRRLWCRWLKKKSRSSTRSCNPFWNSCKSMNRSSKGMPFTMRRISTSRCAWCRYRRINKLLIAELCLPRRSHCRPSRFNRTSRWNKWKWCWRTRIWWMEWWIKWRARAKCRWWWKRSSNNAALKMNYASKRASKRSNCSTPSINLNWRMIRNSARSQLRCKWKPWPLPSNLKEQWAVAKWVCSDTVQHTK